MHQSPLNILTTNHITLPATHVRASQASLNFQPLLDSEDDFRSRWWNASHHQQSFSELISPGWSNSIQVSFVVNCLPSSLQPVMRKKITTPRELRSHQFLNCYEWLRRYLKWEQLFQNGTTKRNFLRKTLTIIRKHTSSSLYVQETGWINCFKSRSNNFTICLQGFHVYVTTLFELLR